MNEEFIKRLKKVIKENPEGFTVDLRGIPYDPNKGYAVGVGSITLEELSKMDLKSPAHKFGYVGGWTDENGKFYLDKVVIISQLDWALEHADKHSQKSIYDFYNKRVIYVEEAYNPDKWSWSQVKMAVGV